MRLGYVMSKIVRPGACGKEVLFDNVSTVGLKKFGKVGHLASRLGCESKVIEFTSDGYTTRWHVYNELRVGSDILTSYMVRLDDMKMIISMRDINNKVADGMMLIYHYGAESPGFELWAHDTDCISLYSCGDILVSDYLKAVKRLIKSGDYDLGYMGRYTQQ